MRKIEFPREQKILEVFRKSFHSAVGTFVIVFFLAFGRFYTCILILSALLIGVALSEISARGITLPIITKLLLLLDRPEDIRFRPGLGPMTLLTGFAIVFVAPYLIAGSPHGLWKTITLCGVLPATFADTLSTVGGVYLGRHNWPYNRRKTIEGSLLNFSAAAIVLSVLIPLHAALITALVVMIVESLPHVDDNLNVPPTASITVVLLKVAGLWG